MEGHRKIKSGHVHCALEDGHPFILVVCVVSTLNSGGEKLSALEQLCTLADVGWVAAQETRGRLTHPCHVLNGKVR